MKSLCSLIPSYNESKTIGSIVRRLIERNFAVYVVDDGSSDDTAAVAEKEGAVVIRHPKNLGKGAAMREGFKHILTEPHEMILVMDGDDQHNVTDIAHLIKRMRETGSGLIIGNRMHDTAQMPYVRVMVNRLMSLLLSAICGQYIPDTQCGFRLIKRELLTGIKLESLNYEIESEMIIRAARAGFKIESVPIKTVYQDEVSKINPAVDTVRFIAFLIRMALKR